MGMELEIRGQKIVLLPEKLAFLPKNNTLLVADTHFGKAATFRQAGIPVPSGTTQNMLAGLSRVIDRLKCERLIVLGDFVHSATRSESDFESELREWREQYSDLRLILVAGNHDRGHAKLFSEIEMLVVREPFVEPPFAYCHYVEANKNESYFTFAGHLHPAVRIPGLPNCDANVPCFAISEHAAIIPAFGEFTGTSVVSRKDYPELYAIADDQVIMSSIMISEPSSGNQDF